MICYDDHHAYGLESFEHPEIMQQLFFIKKTHREAGFPGQLVTQHDGTTNEEVLRMLIHRLKGLQAKFPCGENVVAIYLLEAALETLERRTADRKARGVEGKHLA